MRYKKTQFDELRNKINERKETLYQTDWNSTKEPNRKTLKLNNSVDETKNALETADHMEERIRKLEDRNLGMIQAGRRKINKIFLKIRKFYESYLTLRNGITVVMGVPER